MPASRFQFDLVANVGRFRRGFRSADRVVRGFGDRLGFLRSRLTQVGAALGAFFGGRAIVSGFRAIVGEAATLEEAMARIQAVTGATDDEMKTLRETAVRLGRETQFTADQAAGAMENLGRAGLSTSENIEAIPKVLDLAVASGTNLAQAASIVTGTVRGMGLEFAETGRVVDVLTAASQSANTTVEGLGQAMSQAAPLARNLGLSVEDTSALIGTLANNQIDASRAGTALRKIFVDLDNPTSTFSEALSDAGIETRDLFEVLEQLRRGGPQVEAAINGIGNEAIASLRVLVREADGDLASLVEQMGQAEGASSQAAGVIRDTFNNALKRLGSAWNTVKRALGQPVLSSVREEAEKLQEDLSELADSGKLEKIGKAIASTFREGVQAVRDFLSRFTIEEAVDGAISSVNKLGDAFSRVNGVISRVANAAGALWNFVQGAVGGAMALIGRLAASAAQRFADLASVMARLGLVSDETAEKIQTHVNALEHASNETARYANESLQKAWEQSKRVVGATEDVANAHEEAGDAAEEHGQKEEQAAEKTEQATFSLEEMNRQLNFLEGAQADSASATENSSKRRAAALQEEASAARAHLQELRASGTATQDEIFAASKAYQQAQARAARATEAIARESGKAEQEVNALAEAMEQLGVETQSSLDKTAAEAKANYETIAFSGEASAKEVERAFLAYAEKAIKANGGVANTYVTAAAKTLDLESKVAELGDTAEETGRQASDATRDVGDAAEEAAQKTQQASEAAVSAGRRAANGLAAIVTGLRDKYREVGEGALERFDQLNHKAADGLSTMRGYLNDLARGRDRLDQQVKEERAALEDMQRVIEASTGSTADLARIANFTTDRFKLLGEEQLRPVRNAIQSAQRDLESMRDSAESTLDSLQTELLQLQGREAELARMRNENRRQEIQSQLGEARAAGDQESIRTLEQALEKLDRIGRIEQQRIQQQRQDEQAQRQSQNREVVELRGEDGERVELETEEGGAQRLIEQLERAGLRTQ